MTNPRSICECHCGTRVDINPKLVQERQMWREKCIALEQQFKSDIKSIKDKIYKECSLLMEKEFKLKEESFAEQMRLKNIEISNLSNRLHPMDNKVRGLNDQKQNMGRLVQQLQQEIAELEKRLAQNKKNYQEDFRILQDKHRAELEALEAEKDEIIAKDRKNYEAQIYHLKHQIADFEAKYKLILPQIQKLKSTLVTKTTESEELRRRLCDQDKEAEAKIAELNKKVAANHARPDYSFQMRNLERDLEEKDRVIQRLKNDKREIIKTQVRYETVYIDRPVEVEKIVQKVVEVEKIVKEFVEPKQPVVVNQVHCEDDNDHDEQYAQLVAEINNRTKFIAQLQNELSIRDWEIHEYERVVADYDRNIEKYKSERVKLANTIGDKNREIDSLEARIQTMLMQLGTQQVGRSEDKIIVNVKKDGTYTSNIQRAGNSRAPEPRKPALTTNTGAASRTGPATVINKRR